MLRGLLTFVLAWAGLCGCAGRMNVDLLQARIRQQDAQLAESHREIARTKDELKQSRLEAEKLKSEISQTANSVDLATAANAIQKVKINGLASGGLNKDDLPGDDLVVIQFVPLDSENQPVKIAGDLEIGLIDPQLPSPDREIGRWSFTAEDYQERWTRGIASSGFQLNLPLDQLPRHSELVIQLQYTTLDSRRFLASQKIKVAVAPANVIQQRHRAAKKLVQVATESDDSLPPVGDPALNEEADWGPDDKSETRTTPRGVVIDSLNWSDKTPQQSPQFR